jgi:CHASE2 domain-containing sensor protein
MTTTKQAGDDLTCVMRGFTRAFGLWASTPFVLFLIYSGARVCPKLSWSSPQGMPLLIVFVMATLGVLIAWRWEEVGGTIAVVCAIAIHALVYFGSGRALFYAALMNSVPFFVAGILFLACCWRTRQAQLWQKA